MGRSGAGRLEASELVEIHFDEATQLVVRDIGNDDSFDNIVDCSVSERRIETPTPVPR